MGGNETLAVGLPLTPLFSSSLLEEGSGEDLVVAKNGDDKDLGVPPYVEGFCEALVISQYMIMLATSTVYLLPMR